MGRGEAGVGRFVSLPNGNQPRRGRKSNAKVRQITRPLSQTPVSGGVGLGAYFHLRQGSGDLFHFLAPEQRQAALDKAKEEKSWPTSASWRTAASPGSAHGNAKPSWNSCDKRLEKTTSQDTHVVLVPAAKFGLNFEMSIQSRAEDSKKPPRCRDGKLLVISQVFTASPYGSADHVEDRMSHSVEFDCSKSPCCR